MFLKNFRMFYIKLAQVFYKICASFFIALFKSENQTIILT